MSLFDKELEHVLVSARPLAINLPFLESIVSTILEYSPQDSSTFSIAIVSFSQGWIVLM